MARPNTRRLPGRRHYARRSPRSLSVRTTLSCRPEQITVELGGKPVIFNALMATVDPGDEVVIPAPYWVSYPDIVLLAEGDPVIVPCPAERGFKLDPADLEKAVSRRTKWLILNSPSNPSGAAYTAARITRGSPKSCSGHPRVWVLTDDIYEHIVYDGFRFVTRVQIEPRLYERTLTLNGCSKAYGDDRLARRLRGRAPAADRRDEHDAVAFDHAHLFDQPSGGGGGVERTARVSRPLAGRKVFKERRDLVVSDAQPSHGNTLSAEPEGAFYVYPSCAGVIGRSTAGGKRITSDDDFIDYLLEAEGVASSAGFGIRAIALFPHLLRDLDSGAAGGLPAHPARLRGAEVKLAGRSSRRVPVSRQRASSTRTGPRLHP